MRYTTNPFGEQVVVVQTDNEVVVGQAAAIGRGVFFKASAIVCTRSDVEQALNTRGAAVLTGRAVTPNVADRDYLVKWAAVKACFLWPRNQVVRLEVERAVVPEPVTQSEPAWDQPASQAHPRQSAVL